MNQQPEDLYSETHSFGRRSMLLRLFSAILASLGVIFFVFLSAPVAKAQEISVTTGANFGTTTGQQVVQEALKYEGVPFVLGGPAACVPGWQMDCTCLTTTVFRKFGFELPDVPTALVYYGAPVYGPPRAGDVHVWGPPGDGTGGHVAIDMGNGNIVHANMGTMSTSVTPMYEDPNYLGVWRLVY